MEMHTGIQTLGPKSAQFCTQAYEKPDLLNDTFPLEMSVGTACPLLRLQTLFLNVLYTPVRSPLPLATGGWGGEGQGSRPHPAQVSVYLSHPLHFSTLPFFLFKKLLFPMYLLSMSFKCFLEVGGYK